MDGELRAVIEAATGGPRVANAYLLGAGVAGMHQEHGYSVLPVLYYRINPRRHKELGIESDEKKLASLIAQVENERNR